MKNEIKSDLGFWKEELRRAEIEMEAVKNKVELCKKQIEKFTNPPTKNLV